jgi:hypothetical protein
VFWTPSKYLCTEILYCTLIDTDREIDTDRHQGISGFFIIFVVNLKLGVGGDLQKSRNLNQKNVQKGRVF